MPILAVVGSTTEGKREVLGFSVGDREKQAARARPLRRSQRARRQRGKVVGERWQSNDAQCDCEQISVVCTPEVCDSHNGKCARLRAEQTA